MEFSSFALEIESEQTEFLQTARELGVRIVAYSPLGRGFLTGMVKSRHDLDDKDTRKNYPRFSEDNFGDNLNFVENLSEMAKIKGVTPGQMSLAWVLARGEDFIPTPGTKRVKYLKEKANAANVKLAEEEKKEFRKAVESVADEKGARHPSAMMSKCFGNSPELKL